MSTGINSERMNNVKVGLLDCVEEINAMAFNLDGYYNDLQSSLDGACKAEIISKFLAIKKEWAKTRKIINSYIDVLGKVENSFNRRDRDLASKTIRDIDKIDDYL